MRQINETGLDLIKRAEGLRLQAYKDVRGIVTIGYGHTGNVQMGTFITPEAAEKLLEHDLEIAEECVDKATIVPLTDNQFSALVSLVFNIGAAAFRGSTLLKLLNKRYYTDAAHEFLRWDHVNGVENAGLLARRKAEMALFLE